MKALLAAIREGLQAAVYAWRRERGPLCPQCHEPEPWKGCLNGPCPYERPAEWQREEEWRRELREGSPR